jgi:hypothetical protein
VYVFKVIRNLSGGTEEYRGSSQFRLSTVPLEHNCSMTCEALVKLI